MSENWFYFRKLYSDALRHLEPRDFKDAMIAILDYGLEGKETTDRMIQQAILPLVKPYIDRDKHMAEKQYGRRSAEYQEWRRLVFERDDYTCQRCGQHGGKLNAHHIKPYAHYPSLRYEVDNGITLCKKCHDKIHGKGKAK